MQPYCLANLKDYGNMITAAQFVESFSTFVSYLADTNEGNHELNRWNLSTDFLLDILTWTVTDNGSTRQVEFNLVILEKGLQ